MRRMLLMLMGACMLMAASTGATLLDLSGMEFYDNDGMTLLNPEDRVMIYQAWGVPDALPWGSSEPVDIADLFSDDMFMVETDVGTCLSGFSVAVVPGDYYVRAFNDPAGAVIGNWFGDSAVLVVPDSLLPLPVSGIVITAAELVPEPSSIALMTLVGGAGWIVRRRYRG